MPRPCKRRRVRGSPNVTYFKPAGVPTSSLQALTLAIDEFEAIRLKDLLGLHQNRCAEKMQISQPTFHRLLLSARKKLAEAIVQGKAIQIEKQEKHARPPQGVPRSFCGAKRRQKNP
ncbi:DUF134 domain-containing protein [Candidatus Woesearchaeota archaeon]|nr:MAG: DUF134 domain-containing protein [Candidatus Woesearchaeota archaeon]